MFVRQSGNIDGLHRQRDLGEDGDLRSAVQLASAVPDALSDSASERESPVRWWSGSTVKAVDATPERHPEDGAERAAVRAVGSSRRHPLQALARLQGSSVASARSAFSRPYERGSAC